MMKTQKKSKLTMSQLVLTAVILVLSLVCFLPVVNVIAISLSSKSPILRGEVTFLPVELNFKAYEAIFKDPSMITSLFFTVKITVIYTVLAMILTVLLAYPLSLRRFKGQKIISLFVIFTMYFSGGTIPIYLNIKELGMLNTQWCSTAHRRSCSTCPPRKTGTAWQWRTATGAGKFAAAPGNPSRRRCRPPRSSHRAGH